MLKRVESQRAKIEQSLDLDSAEPESVRMMNSYHALLKRTGGLGPDHERQSAHLLKGALSALDRAIADRRRFKVLAENQGHVFDSPSIETQTDFTWFELELQMKLELERTIHQSHMATTLAQEKDKCRVIHTPALKGR